MLRSCSRCGRIHEAGKCSVKRRITETTRERRFRSINAWTNKSREIRERDQFCSSDKLTSSQTRPCRRWIKPALESAAQKEKCKTRWQRLKEAWRG